MAQNFIPTRPSGKRSGAVGRFTRASGAWGVAGARAAGSVFVFPFIIRGVPQGSQVLGDGEPVPADLLQRSLVTAGSQNVTIGMPDSNPHAVVVVDRSGERREWYGIGAGSTIQWADMTPSPAVLRIVGFPPAASGSYNAYVDDATSPSVGSWAADEPGSWDIPIDPGAHTVTVRSADGTARTARIVAQGGLLGRLYYGVMEQVAAPVTPVAGLLTINNLPVGTASVLVTIGGSPRSGTLAPGGRSWSMPLASLTGGPGGYTVVAMARDVGGAPIPGAPLSTRIDVTGSASVAISYPATASYTEVGVGTLVLRGAQAGWTAALARLSPSPAPIGAIVFDATGTFTSPNLPVGFYALLIGRAGGDNQSRTIPITAGATTTENVSAYFPTASAPVTGVLTVTGEPGWTVALAADGSTTPLPNGVAVLPPTGSIAVPVPVGSYNLGVQNAYGVRMQRIDVPVGGRSIDTRTFAAQPSATVTTSTLSVSGGQAGWRVRWAPIATPDAWNEGHVLTATTGGPWTVPMGRYALLVTRADGTEARGSFAMLSDPYTENLSTYFPAAGTNGGITATGTAGWRLALTSTGSTTPVATAVIPPSGSVTIPAAPGSYSLTVSDDAGHSETRTIVVPTRGLDVNTAEYLASALRPTQGPAPIAGAAPRGTLILSGVPGPSRVLVGGIYTWDTDGTARPIEFSLPVGTHSITANPPQGAPQRRGSVAIAAGARVEVLYGSLTTGQTITADPSPPMVEVDLVQNYVGPILDRPAWAPVTASPGDILRAPDGVNYRVELARAPAVGVVLVRMKADGTPDVAPDVAPPQAPVAEGMSTANKGAIVVGILGLGGAAYYYWTHRATGAAAVKNPARRR